MTIGTGIFFSALFLGVVVLYVFTRDRWKWKKVVLWSAVVLIGTPLLIGAGLYAYDWYEHRPQRVESLWDIHIGASRSDVKFAKGEPFTKQNKDDPSIENPWWIYALSDVRYFVYFDDDKVTRIGAMSNADLPSLPTVLGISTYTSLEEITNKLGPPSHISRSKDELRRVYSFPKFNVAFGIEGGKVYLVVVGVTKERPARLANEVEP